MANMQKGLKRFLIVICVLVAIAVIAWQIGMAVANRAVHRELAEEWPLGLGPAGSVPQRFPKSAMNAEAVRLNGLAAPLGIELQPKSEHKETAAEKEYQDVRESLEAYQSAQASKADDFIDAPPEKVAAYIASHQPAIGALRNELLRGEKIEWPIDLGLLFEAPIPNLLGHVRSAKLFVVDALIKARNNDASAWDDLHAVWMLDEGLRHRPDLISQLIAMAGARTVNAAARKLTPPAPAWCAEMKGYDFRRSIMSSQQTEAYVMSRIAESSVTSIEGQLRPFWWRPAMTAMRPFMTGAGADLVKQNRLVAVEIASLTKCAFDGEAFDRKVAASLPSWDFFGRIAMPNLGSVYHRQIHLLPELEATSNLLALKQERAASATHEWPAVLKDPSSRCSDATWLYERHPDGTAALRFSKAIPPVKVAPQPLEFSLH